MYCSAIFYPPEVLGAKIFILKLNPVYIQIELIRNIIIYNIMPSFVDHIIGFTIGVIFVIIGLIVLKKNQDKFILYC